MFHHLFPSFMIGNLITTVGRWRGAKTASNLLNVYTSKIADYVPSNRIEIQICLFNPRSKVEKRNFWGEENDDAPPGTFIVWPWGSVSCSFSISWKSPCFIDSSSLFRSVMIAVIGATKANCNRYACPRTRRCSLQTFLSMAATRSSSCDRAIR